MGPSKEPGFSPVGEVSKSPFGKAVVDFETPILNEGHDEFIPPIDEVGDPLLHGQEETRRVVLDKLGNARTERIGGKSPET